MVSTDPLRFTAAFVRNEGTYQSGWWWYFGVTVNEIRTMHDAMHIGWVIEHPTL